MITFPSPDELAALDWVKRQIGPPEHRAHLRAIERCAKVGHEAAFLEYRDGELWCTQCKVLLVSG